NLNSLFSEIHHILKPDGLLVLSIPVYDKVAGKIVSKIDKDPTHIHKKSRQFWLRILKQNNFKIISYKGILRYFFLKKYYVHTLTKPLRSHTPAIFIISQKEQTNVVNNNTSI
ncbi:MAG: class I SAM-dependent methyltransferase, partial [Nanoarchaeota archaeon]|nr:class I SAM-dependent methyltransferase [Nanoarchaeota archaeon]